MENQQKANAKSNQSRHKGPASKDQGGPKAGGNKGKQNASAASLGNPNQKGRNGGPKPG